MPSTTAPKSFRRLSLNKQFRNFSINSFPAVLLSTLCSAMETHTVSFEKHSKRRERVFRAKEAYHTSKVSSFQIISEQETQN